MLKFIADSVVSFKGLVNAREPSTGHDVPADISNWGQFFWTASTISPEKAAMQALLKTPFAAGGKQVSFAINTFL